MIIKNCLNLEGNKCKVYKDTECSLQCSGLTTDPWEYMDRLEKILHYNKDNPGIASSIRKEIKAHREKYNLPEIKEQGVNRYAGWYEVYMEDRRRGSGGGSSESDSNAAASMKQLMKDNRIQATKNNSVKREAIKAATEAFEEKHGKLERLSKYPLSRSKVDSYTGEVIE